MRIVILALVLSIISAGAYAQTTTITGLPGSTTIGTQDVLPIDQTSGSSVTTVKETADNIVTNVLTNIATQFSGLCGTFATPTACTYIFGWADPRNYGAVCGANWNVDNGTDNDGPGITAAQATGYSVIIPYPGCKVASTVVYSGNGHNITSFNPPINYSGAAVNPMPAAMGSIFLPTALASSGQNCAFDFHGWTHVSLSNMLIQGAAQNNGSTALCDSYSDGSGNAPQNHTDDFTHVFNVTGTNLGMLFGDSTSSSGVPTTQPCGGSSCMGGSFVQLQMENFLANHVWWAFNINFSDAHFSNFYIDNYAVAFAGWSSSTSYPNPTPSFAPSAEFLNGRLEYQDVASNFTNGAIYQDTGNWEFDNIETDHNNKPDFDITANHYTTLISNYRPNCASNSNLAGYSGAIALESGVKNVSISNFALTTCSANQPSYFMVTKGPVSNIFVSGGVAYQGGNPNVGGGTGGFSWGGTLTNSDIRAVGAQFTTDQNVGIGVGTATALAPLAVVGLGTSAPIGTTTGALSVCVDSGGNFYAKASCP